MKKLILLMIILSPLFVQAQKVKLIPVDEFGNEIPNDTSKWMSKDHIKLLESIKLNYKTPDTFSEISVVEFFENNPRLKSMFGCEWNQLLSKYEQFLAFIPLHRFFTKEDSISFKKSLPGMELPDLNNQHASQIELRYCYLWGKMRL